MKQISLLLLISILTGFSTHAQTYLKTGDHAPSLEGCRWLKGGPVTKFAPGKTYVLVFGASWCAPYLSVVPELGAFAEKHHGELEMITFFIHEQIGKGTGPYGEKVERYLKYQEDVLKGSVAIDGENATLQKAWQIDDMQQNALPFFIIVNGEGKIAWTGNGLTTLEEAVSRMKSGEELAARENIQFDFSKLYLVNNNGGPDDAFGFRSLIARYDGNFDAPNPEFIQNATGIMVDSLVHAGRIQMIGAPLTMLYYTAYSDSIRSRVVGRHPVTGQFSDTIKNPHLRSTYGRWWPEPLLEVADPSPFMFNWKSPANRYNYSMQVPAALGTATFMKKVMQRDLMTYFGYDVTVETRSMPYWKVTVSDKMRVKKQLVAKRKVKSFIADNDGDVVRFQNGNMRDVITMLSYYCGYGSYSKVPREEQGAFIDETGITENIDFEFDMKASFEAVRAYLETKGLMITRSVKPMKVVVIRDPAP